jgi:hypothetical protein
MDEKVIEHMVVKNNKHDEQISKYTGEDLMEENSEDKEILNI